MMKSIKFMTLFLGLGLLLLLIAACSSAEEQPVVELPAAEEVPEAAEEEALPLSVSGEPELLWSVTHENQIHSIAVSPDGETVAVGEYKVTYVHLLADGALDEVIVHEHAVEDLEFSPDGSILGAGQGYHGILLTSILEGKELMSLDHGHNSRLAFSPDGVHIATGDRAGIVWLWRLADGEQLAALEESEVAEKALQNRWVSAINYHPSGKLLTATHSDSTVYIWDLEAESVVHTLQLYDEPFGFSPDGLLMAGAVREDGERLIRLWTVDGADQVADFSDPGEIQGLDFSPDSSLLAVASFGRPTVQNSQSATTIWDISTKTLLYNLDQTFVDSDWPVAVAFTPDGGHLAVARYDGTLELWRFPGAEPLVARPLDIRQPPPLPSDVLFDCCLADLKPAAYPELEEFAEELYAAFPRAKITFIGHTDSWGSSEFDHLQLSIDRAEAVKVWFEDWAAENGVDEWNLQAEGRGYSELKVPDIDIEGNHLGSAAALNRRVEIELEDID
jgi:outer membrane protein OmpA-like peptidoglycan-associated protein